MTEEQRASWRPHQTEEPQQSSGKGTDSAPKVPLGLAVLYAQLKLRFNSQVLPAAHMCSRKRIRHCGFLALHF